MKAIPIQSAIDDILDRMAETEQDSLERIFKRMCIKRGMIGDFDRIKCDHIDPKTREYYYVPQKGAMYFLMKVTTTFVKTFSMDIDYNPELVENNQLD